MRDNIAYAPGAGDCRALPIVALQGAKQRDDIVAERPEVWTAIGDR